MPDSQKYYAAVLGSPITHSKSPLMHHAAYQYLNLNITYDRKEISQQEAQNFFANIDKFWGTRARLAGFSVTMPLKSSFVQLMDSVSVRVEKLGVLNTIVFDENGNAYGDNTDVDGVKNALYRAGFVASGTRGSMGILGAGGTATAAIAAAFELGLEGICFYVRDFSRAQHALSVAKQYHMVAEVKLLEAFPQDVHKHDAIVATLPAYAADLLISSIPAGIELPPLLDVIYDPWPTALASTWQKAGGEVASGLHMLLYQGVEQVRLFTSRLHPDHERIDWETVTSRMATSLGMTQ